VRCYFFLVALILTTTNAFAATTYSKLTNHACETILLEKAHSLTAKMPESVLQVSLWQKYLRAVKAPVKEQTKLLEQFPVPQRSALISLARSVKNFEEFSKEFEPRKKNGAPSIFPNWAALPVTLQKKYPTHAKQEILLESLYQAAISSTFTDLKEPKTAGDILDLLFGLLNFYRSDNPMVDEFRSRLLPSREEIGRRYYNGKVEIVYTPPFKKLREFLRDYKLTFPFSRETAHNFWTNRDFPHGHFIRRLADLTWVTPTPLLSDIKFFQAEIFCDGNGELGNAIRERQLADGSLKDHAYSTWMGDTSTPTAIATIAPFISNRSGRFIDIGSGLGTPLFLLSANFPEMDFLGLEVISEKVAFAKRRAEKLGFHRVHFEEQDLSRSDYRVPAADYYYFYAPVHKEVLEKVIRDILVSTERQSEVDFFFRGMEVPQLLRERENCKIRQLENSIKFVECYPR
jgi:hypothetical protein